MLLVIALAYPFSFEDIISLLMPFKIHIFLSK